MHIPITSAALALMTVAILLIRVFWMRFDPRFRKFLVRGAIAMIVLHALFVVTKWETISIHLNVLINWLAVAGYELLLMLFTRIRPKWLTSLCAAILIVPLFAASIMLPLTGIFEPGSIKRVPMGNDLYYKVEPWSIDAGGNSGVDLDILYSPRFAPFLSHKVQTQAFNMQECNAAAAYAEHGPTAKTVIARCPHSPNQPPGAEEKLLQLP
jgi:hypothetical protein